MLNAPVRCQTALKEWAITVDALARGEQILLLRKGGIHETGKDFRVIHREFLLYPTYEHQKPELLRPEHRPALASLLAQPRDAGQMRSWPRRAWPKSAQPRDAGQITFAHFASVEEALELDDQRQVDALAPHYIWTTDYAQSRLRWKPMLPLSALLLRVFRLQTPVTAPWQPEYGGCTSWVEVLSDIPLGRLEPALSDAEFRARAEAVKGSLGRAAGG